MRGFAAVLVVLFHLREYDGNSPFAQGWGRSVGAGYTGVDVFFVLSGFIIFYIHRKDLGCPDRAGAFCRKRAIRIFPLYELVVAVKLLMTRVPRLRSVHYTPLDVFTSVSLLPISGAQLVLSVSWSLTYELFFYGIFLVAILTTRRFLPILVSVWTVAILAASPFVGADTPVYVLLLLSARNLGFILGIVVAWMVESRRVGRRTAIASTLAGLALFFASFGIIDGLRDPETAFYLARFAPPALGAALVLHGLVRLERLKAFKVARPLVFLGDASYSIYLVHTFGASTSWPLVRHLPQNVAVLVLPVVAIAFGCLVFVSVERPLLRKLRRFAI